MVPAPGATLGRYTLLSRLSHPGIDQFRGDPRYLPMVQRIGLADE